MMDPLSIRDVPAAPMHVVHHPGRGWYALEQRVPGPAAGKHDPVSWARDLDHAARLSPEAAEHAARAFPGAAAMPLTEAWKLTDPK